MKGIYGQKGTGTEKSHKSFADCLKQGFFCFFSVFSVLYISS